MNKVRTYTNYVCPDCGDPVLSGSVLGGTAMCQAHPEPVQAVRVTAIDARDVEPLVAAARALDQALWDQIRERLKEALAPFDSSTQEGE